MIRFIFAWLSLVWVASAADGERFSLAAEVTIHRDAWGTPHIHGKTDAATVFGFGYIQAEDNFWQLEDNYILAQGRYSEVHGPRGLNSDLLNRAFEIVPKAKAMYASMAAEDRELIDAFAAGINCYLASHPQTRPRLIEHFEPWHVVAFGRHTTLELCYRYTGLNKSYLPRSSDSIADATGSNGWALGPSHTKSGHAMLMVNPHLPWFGFSQMHEAHLKSDGGNDSPPWSFTGATFHGNLLLTLGHNEHLGWTFTTNEPNIADTWIETFDDAANPLAYRYGDQHRTATEWTETVLVATAGKPTAKQFTFRKTHHGPCVSQLPDEPGKPSRWLAARIAGLDSCLMLRGSMALMRARSLDEFRSALSLAQFPLMNVLYADRAGNIGYWYNGRIPKRDATVDWRGPVDGSDPRTEWQGVHPLDELPTIVNPRSGYLQNCNSSPFTTCDNDNPSPGLFPPYMIDDAADDKRRAKRSRQILSGMKGVTLDDFATAAFDTEVYWAKQELPLYANGFAKLEANDPALAATVKPYLDHLLAWNGRISQGSTAATLCGEWYEELFGHTYPGETLRPQYAADRATHFAALATAASKLRRQHGTWQVAWGDVHRVQRSEEMVDLLSFPFDDSKHSLPTFAGPGPMGIIFTQYDTPSVNIPFVKKLSRRYGIVGATYLAVYEFGDTVSGQSVMNYGTSADPASPHYFDQAALMHAGKMKREIFAWDDVLSAAVRTYRPE